MSDLLEIQSIEIAALKAWPAPTVNRVGDWWMRSAEGFTGRGNSTLALGDPGVSLDDAIERVTAFYRRLEEPAMVDVPHPISAPVADALDARGWRPLMIALVQTVSLPDLLAATPSGDEFDLVVSPSSEHLDQIRDSRSMLPKAALHLLTGVAPLIFAERWDDGALVSRGRGTVTDGRLGLYSIATSASARGRGLAAAGVGRLARWSVEHGATSAFLQVESTNDTAIRLYRRLGFQTHHHYTRYVL